MGTAKRNTHSFKRIRGAEEENESKVVTASDNSLPQRNLEVEIPARRASARASGQSPIPPSTVPSEVLVQRFS